MVQFDPEWDKPGFRGYVPEANIDAVRMEEKKNRQRESMRKLRADPEYREAYNRSRRERNARLAAAKQGDMWLWHKIKAEMRAERQARINKLEDGKPRQYCHGMMMTQDERDAYEKKRRETRAEASEETKAARAAYARDRRKKATDKRRNVAEIHEELAKREHEYAHIKGEMEKHRLLEVQARMKYFEGSLPRAKYNRFRAECEDKFPDFWVSGKRARL